MRRVYIPKADGRQRPLGIPVLEDKIAQRDGFIRVRTPRRRHEVRQDILCPCITINDDGLEAPVGEPDEGAPAEALVL